MPTFKHDWIIGRALNSLLAQDFTAWELIVVDDGSPDGTRAALAPYVTDARIRYHRFDRNRGLGAVLNHASRLATGQYLAYLPSDDLYHPDHLSTLVGYLDAHPDRFLAYSGVRSHRYWWGWGGLTLQGDVDYELQGSHVVGAERRALAGELPHGNALGLYNDNILALVQVMHRRDPAHETRWTERTEFVSDSLEPDGWRRLLDSGHRFGCTGRITCEWTDHPGQRHKIIAEAYDRPPPLEWPPGGRGLSAYRRHYGIARGEAIDWRPTMGPKIDERRWFDGLPAGPDGRPAATGLKIHIVGELGFNPERILALERAGHRLSATWVDVSETWDTASSLPIGNIVDIPWGPGWRERLAAQAPDVIYALLNVHAVPLIRAVLHEPTGLPLVFHFKESPQRAMAFGLWPQLSEILARCDGLILISAENLDWYRYTFPAQVREDRVLVMDGDLPHGFWMSDEWSPKLSAADGGMHIVSVGRLLNLRRVGEAAQAGVHVHSYGSNFHPPEVERLAEQADRVHLHRTVEPAGWVAELSRYDAAWAHDIASDNRGDIRKAAWSDLNLPARLGTYAAAGLPWLVRAAPGSVSATLALGRSLEAGIGYESVEDLADALRRRDDIRAAAEAMRERRHRMTFDHHEPRLTAFLRRIVHGSGR